MNKLLPILLIALLVGCINMPGADLNQGGNPVEKDETRICAIDADCVAATCCHPKKSVNYQYAPDCTDIACTTECAPMTVDCGQGYFACINEQCQTIINAPL